MTRANLPPPARRALNSALSVSLIIVLLTAQTPALPLPLTDLASGLRNDLKFWLHSSGWTTAMRRLISQSSAAQPEKQSDRTARVTSIKVFPGDVTIRTGVPEFFDALAYDAKGQQAGGVKFTWRAEDDSGKTPMKISPSGEFVPPTPGSYRIIAEGAGQTAQLIVKAVDRPVKEMQINVVEEPGPGWNPGNFGAMRDPGNERGDPPANPNTMAPGAATFSSVRRFSPCPAAASISPSTSSTTRAYGPSQTQKSSTTSIGTGPRQAGRSASGASRDWALAGLCLSTPMVRGMALPGRSLKWAAYCNSPVTPLTAHS